MVKILNRLYPEQKELLTDQQKIQILQDFMNLKGNVFDHIDIDTQLQALDGVLNKYYKGHEKIQSQLSGLDSIQKSRFTKHYAEIINKLRSTL